MGKKLLGVGMLMPILAGCASVKPDAKVAEAMDLVAEKTGQRPQWTVPWDDSPPAWDGQAVLGLDEAVVMALRNNRELRADLEMIGQANADLVQAGLMQNPVINFMMMFPAGGGRSMLRSAGLPMQPLQDLWLIPVRQEVARAQLQEAILRVADRAVETAAEVKKVYARLQYTQRAIELIRENMQVVEQSRRIIEIRQTAGQATQVEVNLAQIRYMRLRSDLLATEAQHRALQRELLMLLGLAAAPDTWAVGRIHEIKDPVEAPIEEPVLVDTALSQRLDFRAAEWQVQAAEQRIRLMQREGWPDLAVGFTLERMPAPRSQNPQLAGRLGNAAAQGAVNGLTGRMGGSGGMVSPFNPKMRDVEAMFGPMIEMEVPIFDQNQAQVARAYHEHRQRLAEYEARRQALTRMVRETRVMEAQAYDQVRYFRESIIPAVERNLNIARQSYVAGREDLTIFLQVQEDLITTRLKLLEFLRDYRVNRAELERQVGGRLEPSPATQPASGPAE